MPRLSARPRNVVALLGLAVALLTGSPAHAQTSPFVDATGLTCSFKVLSTGNWARGGDASAKTSTVDLPLEFTNLNTTDGSASWKGSTGNLLITVMLVGGNLHLVVTNTGGLFHLTTVSASESRPGFYKAVHSRHELTESAVLIPGYTSRPEQYLGECAITKH
ncbi:MAG: hypothetical protein AB7P67_13875 [Vicinamibacterales bacterium]